MTDSLIISPPKFYEVNGEVTPIMVKGWSLAAATNYAMIGAVSGKRIRFMGLFGQGAAAVSRINFKDGATGTNLGGSFTCPSDASGLNLQLPIVHSGYFETSTGVALGLDVAGASVYITVFYIIYTP